MCTLSPSQVVEDEQGNMISLMAYDLSRPKAKFLKMSVSKQ